MRTKLRRSTLTWNYQEHWSGEIATFDVCGLHVWVRDMDGDGTVWEIRNGRRGPVLASGKRHSVDDFVECAAEAEEALRQIVAARIEELRAVKFEASFLAQAEGGAGDLR